MLKLSSVKYYTSDYTRELAKARLPKIVFDYIDGSSLTEFGEKNSRDAIKKIQLSPRILRKINNIDISHIILNQRTNLPFGIAPMGMCNLIHSKADTLIAKFGKKFNSPVCFSTMASTKMEETIKIANQNSWFQLYVDDDLDKGINLAKRASKAGYKTLIFTVDVPALGIRPREIRHNFKVPFKPNLSQIFDFLVHPRWSLSMLINGGSPRPANFKNTLQINRSRSRAAADWNFLKRLRNEWKGNLIVKGVLNEEDALVLKKFGIDCIYISGHGGRQLDSFPPPIIQLEKIRKIVGNDFPLIYDTGIRNGEDIVKAYAKGADFVMIGRAALYAIACSGEKGLEEIKNNFCEEIKVTMTQLGLSKISLINSKCISL